jgi:hypothetical protein
MGSDRSCAQFNDCFRDFRRFRRETIPASAESHGENSKITEVTIQANHVLTIDMESFESCRERLLSTV